jgi:hypothetical protein
MGDLPKFVPSTKISYDCAKEEWCESEVEVDIETVPFSKGAMRSAYKMKLKLRDGTITPWVAKRTILTPLIQSFLTHTVYHAALENDLTEEDAFKNDVVLQSTACYYADLYGFLYFLTIVTTLSLTNRYNSPEYKVPKKSM